MKKNKGFTLIELLVVIAIIGLISSIVLGSLSVARAKSRDSRRKAEMRQMQNAIELYYTDNKAYPSTGSAFWGMTLACGGNHLNADNGATKGYIPGVAPAYMKNLPTDPSTSVGDAQCVGYSYKSDGTHYKLIDSADTVTRLNGPESFPPSSDLFYDAARPTWALKVCDGDYTTCTTW